MLRLRPNLDVRIALMAALFSSSTAPFAFANQPPNTPFVTEPTLDGQIVNPADVHMECAAFTDPDPGDAHLCSDWEIRLISNDERVWFTSCIGGVERVHSHLGDGTFEGSHAGRTELFYSTAYKLRTRHRDDSGDPPTEWSDWGERLFQTGPPTEIFPLELDDILSSPTPQWTDTLGAEIVLPGGAEPPSLRIESAAGDLILEFQGLDGLTNIITNPPSIGAHADTRLRFDAGNTGGSLLLPESDVSFVNDESENVTIYLPPTNLPPNQQAFFWVAENGSTYVGQESQTEPDFSEIARGAPVPWSVTQPGFKVEVIGTGFELPVNIAFVVNPLPGPGQPRYYVTELYGQIKVVTNDGTVSDYVTGLLNFSPTGNFPGSGEQGLAGIAIDPATGDLFCGMLYDDGGPHHPKVVRFQSTDGGLTASSQTTILDMAGETQGQSHQISNITVGPDGKLYVHMGDGFDSATAQNLDSYRGKILRMDFDGSPATDNPFYDAGNGINSRDYVFAYGVRNPFGGQWRASDGFHYEVENGPSRDRFAKIVESRNYLWDGSNQSMENFAIYVWNPATGPVNLAFIQPETFGGSGFPVTKMDHAFVSESGPTWASGPQSNGKRISEFVLDANGDLVSGPTPLIEYSGSGKATVVALTAGPDGLYFSDFYKDQDYQSPIDRGSNILRVQFVGTADFTADVTSGPGPLTVQFTDTSNVPSPTDWSWEFGNCATSDVQNPQYTFTENGVYDIQLAVTGSGGLRVTQKNGYILVGDSIQIAMIGGSIPQNAADADIADFLRGLGYVVDAFDDEPANRPSASTLAANYDLVIISSTTNSSNVAGEFRNEVVPLIYWESALNTVDRIPLCSGGSTANDTDLNVLDDTHPVTQGLTTGPLDVFSSSQTMSFGQGTLGPDVTVLATRNGQPGDYALMVAESGAELLGGHFAPARRVFMFFNDNSWLSATSDAEQILEHAVAWTAGQPATVVIGDMDGNGAVDYADVAPFANALVTSAYEMGCVPERLDLNGDDSFDGRDIDPFINCVVFGTCP